MLLAEAWHIPPWRIEDEAPALWVERWEALQIARQRAAQKPMEIPVGGTVAGVGGLRKTRVM